MSLTLREAQYSAWKTLKKFEKIDESRAEKFGSADNLIQIAEKAREKIKVLKNSSLVTGGDELAKLFSELLFLLLTLSERYGIKLEESFLESVNALILDFVS